MVDIDTLKVKCHVKESNKEYYTTLDKLLKEVGIDLMQIKCLKDYNDFVNGILKFLESRKGVTIEIEGKTECEEFSHEFFASNFKKPKVKFLTVIR